MKDGVTGSHGVLFLGNHHPQSAEKSSVNLGKVKMFPAVLEQLLNQLVPIDAPHPPLEIG